MKQTLIVLFAGLIGVNFTALADSEKTKELTPLQKTQIAWALKILGDSKTLVLQPDQCVQIDEDILSVLELEGRLKSGDVEVATVCFGGGPGSAVR
ncbi:MAG: hypothetical protein JNL11_17020 [Bdellovibrionaceae bacterium]|nr:hypothetical protein [Pseudobdellovibrionaceae bacterium]